MSPPTRSASSISSSRDMLRYAAQNQSGQSNRTTATLRPKRTETQAAEPTPTEVDTATRPHITGAAANTDLESRIKALEDQQNNTRDTVDALEQLYIRLKESVNHLEYQSTLQPAHRQAPSSSTTGLRTPADDGSFNVPLQGDLSDESFAFIMKMFAGQKINADHWENVVSHYQGSLVICSHYCLHFHCFTPCKRINNALHPLSHLFRCSNSSLKALD
ncbi:hypothetical protein BKA58DRAFT_383785 [Alternaria rosae]|uniref:uncharacterized protein n=1 Tax=Alternaria rosae TaxID=1187941 RepID=UPI001E8ED047|nr:uncharacterized protein BKA58DRAFT_383785 [Alternaria rosae]KAH6873263.1 hypothetical protein BKA58DRAFT_383785 [Alternaria rosae]